MTLAYSPPLGKNAVPVRRVSIPQRRGSADFYPSADNAMPDLVLNLFGGPSLRGADGSILLSPYQKFALTVLGTAREAGVDRSHLAWLLWEEDDTPACRQRIRQLLHGLRIRTGADLFCEGRAESSIRLDPRMVRTDFDLFEDFLRTGRLQDAATIVARGLGQAVARPPTDEFEDWLDAQRRGCEERLRDAAARAWDVARARHDWPTARGAAEAAYLLTPNDESVLRMVLEARAATGALQGAQVAFSMFVERLPEGTDVSPVTRALAERVGRLQASLEDADERVRVPLIGRAEEMGRLRSEALEPRPGRLDITVIQGDGGIGKSRILTEVVRDARLAGVRPLTAQAVEPERRIPMMVLMDALADTDLLRHVRRLAQPWRTLVAEFLPAEADVDRLASVPPIREEHLTRRLLDAFTVLLGQVASEEPVLICIDDLQWVDDTTLSVLSFAKRRWGDGRLGVIGTIRTDSLPRRDSPGGALATFLAAATRVIEVGEMSDEAARDLIHATANHTLNDDVVRQLEAMGGRNPFYLIELTNDVDAGRVTPPAVAGETLPLPVSLQDLFDRRFNGLDTLVQRLAELLSVRSRPMTVHHLAMLADTPEEKCALAVDELVRHRLVRVERGTITVRHELFRSAFYRRITPARVAVLHDRIAAHLLETCDPVPHSEMAVHYAKAGRNRDAVEFGRVAADQALASGAAAEAAYFLELIVECEEDERGVAEATGDLGRLLHSNREMARAAPVLELAAGRLRRIGRPDLAVRMDIRRVECLAEVEDIPLARSVDRLTEIKLETRDRADWEATAHALDTELHLLHQECDTGAIEGVFEEMRECAAKGTPAAACLAHCSLALNILFGDPNEALASAREAVRLAELEGQREHLLMAQTRLVVVLYVSGMLNLPEPRRVLASVRDSLSRSSEGGLRILVEANFAAFLVDIGQYEAAEEVFEQIYPDINRAEAVMTRFNFFTNWGEAALLRGEWDTAMKRFSRAAEGIDRVPEYMAAVLYSGVAHCALETGNLETVRRIGERASVLHRPLCYDPSPILRFRVKLARRRRAEAAEVQPVRDTASGLGGRLILPWLKVKAIEAQLVHRLRHEQDESVETAATLAEQLLLPQLRRQILARP